jgi:hypothetical protein
MARSIFCAEEAPPRKNLLCQSFETSNIGALGFIDGDVVIPAFATVSDFVTFVRAQVLLCKASIIQNLVASKPLAAEVTSGKNYGNRTNPQVLSTDHTLSGFDRDHLDNVPWWNDKVKDASDQNFFYVSNNYYWLVTGSEASVSFGTVIAEDGKTPIEGQFSIKWNQSGEPVPVYLAGIRSALNRPMLINITNANPSGFVETTGKVFTIASTTAGSIDFNSSDTSTQPFAWSLVGTAIPGLTLDTTSGILSGTPTTPGTYTRDIRVQNPCGIYGLVRIKVVVS